MPDSPLAYTAAAAGVLTILVFAATADPSSKPGGKKEPITAANGATVSVEIEMSRGFGDDQATFRLSSGRALVVDENSTVLGQRGADNDGSWSVMTAQLPPVLGVVSCGTGADPTAAWLRYDGRYGTFAPIPAAEQPILSTGGRTATVQEVCR